MKAYRYEYDSTSVFCQIWSAARRGLFAVAPLQARGTTIVNSPHFLGPRNSEPAQPPARGSPGEGKTPTFSHKPADSPFPRQGEGRSCICSGARLKLGAALAGLAVSSRLLPHGGRERRSVWAALQTPRDAAPRGCSGRGGAEMLLSLLSLLPHGTVPVPAARECRG